MLTVKYHEDGEIVADKKTKQFVDDKIKAYLHYDKKDMTLIVANALIIDCFRLAVRESALDHNDIVFATSNDLHICIDKEGQLESWPAGFCDENVNILMKLM